MGSSSPRLDKILSEWLVRVKKADISGLKTEYDLKQCPLYLLKSSWYGEPVTELTDRRLVDIARAVITSVKLKTTDETIKYIKDSSLPEFMSGFVSGFMEGM